MRSADPDNRVAYLTIGGWLLSIGNLMWVIMLLLWCSYRLRFRRSVASRIVLLGGLSVALAPLLLVLGQMLWYGRR
ncbi:MAG: hypothetical protein H6835_16575 [Planctomycetes bacterium]|nr:hypothetical protein [Planctomycetota bacterium]